MKEPPMYPQDVMLQIVGNRSAEHFRYWNTCEIEQPMVNQFCADRSLDGWRHVGGPKLE